MSTTNERRIQERCPSNCQCWIEQDSVTLLGKATNLSHSGMFIETLPIIETGSEISIRIELQDIGNFKATGKIRWKHTATDPEVISGRDSKIPGLGIEFSAVESGKELLAQYLENRKR